LAWNEKSSDDRRHPVPSLPIACPFGSSYWAISEATWTLPRDGNDIKQTMHSAPAFEIGPFDNMALAVPVWPGCHRQQFRSQVGLKNLGDSRCRQLRKLNKEAPADV